MLATNATWDLLTKRLNFLDLKVDPFDAEWHRKIDTTTNVPKLEGFLEFQEIQRHVIEQVTKCSSPKKSAKRGHILLPITNMKNVSQCPTFQGDTIDKGLYASTA